MKAVILAAGEGKRLRPFTDSVPKPMIKIGGKPILEYTLDILPREVDEVGLVVGYRRETITKHFGETFGGRKLAYIVQPEPRGTGEALLRARNFLNGEPFLLLYADDLYHPEDLTACVSDTPTVLVKEHPHPERFGVCMVDDNDRLLGILEKRPDPPTNLVNVGVYFLNKHIFEMPMIRLASGEYNLAEQIGVMSERHNVYVRRARFWHPIGYPEDLDGAERFLRLTPEKRLN